MNFILLAIVVIGAIITITEIITDNKRSKHNKELQETLKELRKEVEELNLKVENLKKM